MNQQTDHWLYSQLTTEAIIAAQHAFYVDAQRHSDAVVPTESLHIAERIYQRVVSAPNSVAITDERGELSYAALWQGATIIADSLRAQGVTKESLVAVKLTRNAIAVTAMLGVWLAGGAYVPIDPAAPARRQQLIIDDACCPVMLVDHVTSEDNSGVLALNVDDVLNELPSALPAVPTAIPPDLLTPSQLAYVIYTSGSTGMPKGVLVEHQQFCALLTAGLAVFTFSSADVWSCFHSFAFDVSVWEVWGALCTGAQVLVVPYEVTRDPVSFHEWLQRYQVTVLSQTPSAFYALSDVDQQQPANLRTIRYVIFAGEALSLARLRPWTSRYALSEQQLINMYGITETTVHATFKRLNASDFEPHSAPLGSPIGQPLAHLHFVLIDPNSEHIERAQQDDNGIITGELILAGGGVTRGYLERPELNAARFINVEGQRYYRSGDLVSCDKHGNYWYINRLDNQVNLHGYRIELGEIESAISQHAQVHDVCVTVDQQQQQLIAWLRCDTALTRSELSESLTDKLPLYMRPNHYRCVTQFPLTANGKLDRNALINSDFTLLTTRSTYLAARNELEATLVQAWQQVFSRQIGVFDDFFALGGDSIRSIKLANLLRSQQLFVAAHQLFTYPTVAALAEFIAQQRQLPPTQVNTAAVDSASVFSLTASQQGMYFHSVSSERADMYVEQLSFAIAQPLQPQLFKLAWQLAVEQFPVLRTRFITNTSHDVQQEVMSAEQAEWRWTHQDLPATSATQWQDIVAQTTHKAAHQGFDLTRAGLFSIDLLQHHAQQHLVWTWHHLILDGWSLTVVLDQVFENYRALVNASDPTALSAHALIGNDGSGNTFAEYVAFQQNKVTDAAFWSSMFADYQPQAPLGIMRATAQAGASNTQGTEINEVRLSARRFSALQRVAQQHAVPVNSVITAMWQIVASLYHQTVAPVIGVTLSGRSAAIADIEQAVGVLINTLPLRQRIQPSQAIGTLLQQTFSTFCGVLAREHDSLADIQQQLKAEYATTDAPLTELFDTLLVFENYLGSSESESGENAANASSSAAVTSTVTTAGEETPTDSNTSHYLLSDGLVKQFGLSHVALKEDTNYPITVTIFPNDTLLLRVMSDASRVDQRFVQPMLTLFATLLETLPELAEQPVEALIAACLPTHSVSALSPIPVVVQPQWRLEQGLAQHAQQQPNAIALYAGNSLLTYAELDARSNQLANYLLAKGVTAEDRIGVYFPREADLVIAMYAVLKAGAAYVPLDLDYPEERIAFIASDAQCNIILALSRSACPFDTAQHSVCYVDNEREAITQCATTLSDAHVAKLHADQAAYFIYTSGSTGQPKGVQINHRNVQSLVTWAEATYTTEQLQCVLASTSICFDISVFELFVPIALGQSVCLVSSALQMIYDTELPAISLVNSVPSIARELVQQQAIPDTVSVVNLAGEPLPRSLVNQLYDLASIDAVYNLYGPSEDTTYSTAERVPNHKEAAVYIGQPLPGSIAWVVNPALTDDVTAEVCWPLPLGCEGELILSGVGVATGYLNRPEQTHARFTDVKQVFSAPFAQQLAPALQQQAAYRTGDRVRWSADGKLEYLGRQDHQVKFRGVRIELQEIQLVAECFEGVDSCVVLVKKDDADQPQLVAYVTGESLSSTPFAHTAFIDALRQQLPVSMVPTAVFALDSFPLTPNKKIDVQRLPTPSATTVNTAADVTATTERFIADTPVARTLYQLWCDILDKPEIPANGDFFALGGHSLMATKLMVAVQAEWGLSLRLSQILQMPTLAAQVAYVEENLTATTADEVFLAELAGDDLSMSDQELLDELSELSDDELDVLLNLADEE